MERVRQGAGLQGALSVAGGLLLVGTVVPWVRKQWTFALLQDNPLIEVLPRHLLWSEVAWVGLWIVLGVAALIAGFSHRSCRAMAPYLACVALAVWVTGWSGVAGVPLRKAPLDPAVCGSILVLILFAAWSRADTRLGTCAWSQSLGRGLLLAVWVVALGTWSHRSHLSLHLMGADWPWSGALEGTDAGAGLNAARISSLLIFGIVGMAVVAATVRVLVGHRGRWIRRTLAVLTFVLILVTPRTWLISPMLYLSDAAPDLDGEMLHMLPAYARVLGLMGMMAVGVAEVLLRVGSRDGGRKIAEPL